MNMKKTGITGLLPMRLSWIVVTDYPGVPGALAANFGFAA
jgi:hypothetical protein